MTAVDVGRSARSACNETLADRQLGQTDFDLLEGGSNGNDDRNIACCEHVAQCYAQRPRSLYSRGRVGRCRRCAHTTHRDCAQTEAHRQCVEWLAINETARKVSPGCRNWYDAYQRSRGLGMGMHFEYRSWPLTNSQIAHRRSNSSGGSVLYGPGCF